MSDIGSRKVGDALARRPDVGRPSGSLLPYSLWLWLWQSYTPPTLANLKYAMKLKALNRRNESFCIWKHKICSSWFRVIYWSFFVVYKRVYCWMLSKELSSVFQRNSSKRIFTSEINLRMANESLKIASYCRLIDFYFIYYSYTGLFIRNYPVFFI